MTGRAGDATPAMPPTPAEIPIVARENLQGHYAGFASRFVALKSRLKIQRPINRGPDLAAGSTVGLIRINRPMVFDTVVAAATAAT